MPIQAIYSNPKQLTESYRPADLDELDQRRRDLRAELPLVESAVLGRLIEILAQRSTSWDLSMRFGRATITVDGEQYGALTLEAALRAAIKGA